MDCLNECDCSESSNMKRQKILGTLMTEAPLHDCGGPLDNHVVLRGEKMEHLMFHSLIVNVVLMSFKRDSHAKKQCILSLDAAKRRALLKKYSKHCGLLPTHKHTHSR